MHLAFAVIEMDLNTALNVCAVKTLDAWFLRKTKSNAAKWRIFLAIIH